MSTLYSTVIRGVAQRAGMLRGETTPGIQTSYNTTPLRQADLGDGPYPLTQLHDCVLQAEELLAMTIANTAGNSFRDYLLSFTDVITSGDVLPSTDANGVQIIGTWGGVFDGADPTVPCTPQPIEIVRRWLALSSYLKSSLYYYVLLGNQVLHTRASVVLQCCIYSRSAQSIELEANNDMLLPDVLESALVAGAVSMLVNLPAAPTYRAYFNDVLGAIQANTIIPPMAVMKQVQEAA